MEVSLVVLSALLNWVPAPVGCWLPGVLPSSQRADRPDPAFSRANNTYLRAQVGSTVVLHCPAHNLGENTVSWVRRRDYHLITVGLSLYTSDQRYQVRYVNKDKDWQLHIRYLQRRDESVYECQVSSHPPVSLLTELRVLEPKSEILGGPERFLRTGSGLRLVCVLRRTTQDPAYVFWYLDARMINHDPQVRVETSGSLSVLFLSALTPRASGNYTCAPSNARPATIRIHVLNDDEIPAAIQSSSAAAVLTSLAFSSSFIILSLLLVLCSRGFLFGRVDASDCSHSQSL